MGAIQFTIRPVTEGDQADIYRLLGGDKSQIPRDDFRHPANEAEALVTAGRDTTAQGRGWLAIADGKPVGMITTKDFSGGVIVDKDYRRNGIAEALVTTREEYMYEHGQTEARTDIRADNKGSLRLFTKLGYHFDEASQAEIDGMPNAADVTSSVSAVPVLVLKKNLAEAGLIDRWRNANTRAGTESQPLDSIEQKRMAKLSEEDLRLEEQDRTRLKKLEDRFRLQPA